MIPALDSAGNLPPGRYRASFEEIEDRFVNHPQFATSSTRAGIWEGLGLYLQTWEALNEDLACPQLLRWLWIGGSFTSSRLNPKDIDVSPVVDYEVLQHLKGRPGVGRVRALFEQRRKVVERYQVEPMPIHWRAIASTYTEAQWGSPDRDYLERRGALDDWWQRCRGLSWDGGAPIPEDAPPRRGYLEVEL
ncbi:DUF6932 family protein [Amycolatopsis thermoflava]